MVIICIYVHVCIYLYEITSLRFTTRLRFVVLDVVARLTTASQDVPTSRFKQSVMCARGSPPNQ